MSIFQFLRIVWARRMIVLAATVSCVIGAVLVILIAPPRFEGKSRVMLETYKPDPVTGQTLAAQALRVFTRTQAELIRDYRVAGRVVDELGLATDPGLVRLYQASTNGEQDFRRWAAQRIIENTQASLLEGSNILEITYTSPNPEQARAVADALRKAYIDVSVELRRESAARNAEWYEAQTEIARRTLNTAESAKTAYERETGVVLPDGQTDVDSERLRALASSTIGTAPIAMAPGVSALGGQLAQADAAIAQAQRTLGPNHPDLQAMRAQRAALAAQYAREQAQLAGAASASSGGVAAVDRAVQQQKSRVIANREVVEKLRQLQAEVDLRRDQFQKTAQRAAELRREAAAADAQLTPLGNAATPRSPSFPNKPLILLGSLALGLGVGVGVGLLIELFARRVRSFEDLAAEIDAPVLAVITTTTRRSERKAAMALSGPKTAPALPRSRIAGA